MEEVVLSSAERKWVKTGLSYVKRDSYEEFYRLGYDAV
jgi:hypothetical protein